MPTQYSCDGMNALSCQVIVMVLGIAGEVCTNGVILIGLIGQQPEDFPPNSGIEQLVLLTCTKQCRGQ
jgi:hypothetical protein